MSEQYDNETQLKRLLEALATTLAPARIPQGGDLTDDERERTLHVADARIDLVRSAMCEILAGLSRARNASSPVSKLPSEVLITIWSQPNITLADLLSISRVNAGWRTTSLNATSLWTRIDLERFSGRKIAELVARSGDAPLRLSVGRKPLDAPRSVRDEQTTTNSGRDRHRLHQLLLGHDSADADASFHPSTRTGRSKEDASKRLASGHLRPYSQTAFDAILGRVASLSAEIGPPARYYMSMKALGTPMPNLQYLALSVDASAMRGSALLGSSSRTEADAYLKERPAKLFGGHTPRLRSVKFVRVHAAWDDPLYSNLTQLCIVNPTRRATLPQVDAIIRRCPALRQLELRSAFKVMPRMLANTASIRPSDMDACTDLQRFLDRTEKEGPLALPRMRSLVFEEGNTPDISRFLASFDLPALDNLTLYMPDTSCVTDQCNHGRLLPAIKKSFPRTKQVKFVGSPGQLCVIARTQDMEGNPPRTWQYVCRAKQSYTGSLLQDLSSAITRNDKLTPLDHVQDVANQIHRDGQQQQSQMDLLQQQHQQHATVNGHPLPQLQPSNAAPHMGIFGAQPGTHPQPNFGAGIGLYHHGHSGLHSSGQSNLCDPLQFLHQLERAGMKWTEVEKIEIGGGLSDVFYRDILNRSPNIRVLRLTSNSAMRILTDVVGSQLGKGLEEIQLVGMSDIDARRLSVWTEIRTARADREGDVRRVRRIRVHLAHRYMGRGTLDSDSRARIERALTPRSSIISSIFGTKCHNVVPGRGPPPLPKRPEEDFGIIWTSSPGPNPPLSSTAMADLVAMEDNPDHDGTNDGSLIASHPDLSLFEDPESNLDWFGMFSSYA